MKARLLLLVLGLAGCDQLMGKKDGDAGAIVAVAVVDAGAAPTAPAATPAPPSTDVPLLGKPGTTPTGTVVVKPTDGGVKPTDGGTAPAQPGLVIPTIPGFDAGGFKPPAGFPTAIPGIPTAKP